MFKTYISILFVLIFVCYSNVNAQETSNSLGLAVSPAILDISLDRGEILTKEITLKSTSNTAVGFVVSTEGVVLSDFASISNDEIKPPDWIKNDPKEFILNPGEVRKINVIFSPSNKITPGGYYGTIYIQPVADLTRFVDERTTSVPKVGVLILAKVKGKMVHNLVFTGFRSRFINFSKESIVLSFENLGNVHEMPSGDVKFLNLITGKITNIVLTPSIVFPDSAKNITLQTQSALSAGLYKVMYSTGKTSHVSHILILDNKILLTITVLTICGFIFTLYIINCFINKRKLSFRQ